MKIGEEEEVKLDFCLLFDQTCLFKNLNSRRAGLTFILMLEAPLQFHHAAINFAVGEKIRE